MVVSKTNLIKYLIMVLGCAVACWICAVTNDPSLHIFLMWGVTLLAIILAEFDLAHPYFWFSLFFALYNSASTIIRDYSGSNYNRDLMMMPLLALSIVLVIVGPKRIPHERYKNCPRILKSRSLLVVIQILTILTIIFSLILHLRGYISKTQMKNEGDIFYRLGVHFARYLVFFLLLYVAKAFVARERYAWTHVFWAGLATLLFSLFTSERDVVFRFGFTVLLLFFAFDKIRRRHLLVLFPLVMVVMVASVYFKHYFMRGTLNDTYIQNGNILTQFLSTDFSAAGSNLAFLLQRPWTKGSQGIVLYFTELFNPILFGVQTVNPDHWFNYVVHTGSFKGHAFTLVGTGYIIAGYWGVVLVFVTVALIVRILYRNSAKNVYWIATYIYMASTIVFSFRMSLRSITSSLVNHVLLAILFCLIWDRVRFRVHK